MKNDLKLEDAINNKLSGDTQKNALDLVVFMGANGFSFEWFDEGSAAGWALIYKSINIGCILTFDVDFNLCFGLELDFSNIVPEEDDMKETIWAKLSFCGKCNDNWETCSGVEKTILGKTFDNLCHSPMCFINPDVKTLENMKKLLLLLKQKRDNMQRTK